ncbi:glycosyltransferase family 2 protein [Methylobacterium nodulans]|uniref:Glycosyl transferase family 2 n=1 Tax=Methylobacterium nodulans (strain LMG 21967 / CNCM I-2342 / ORS 2060) TaxID=460265 RepID=B8IIY3_METNO|nr:glycosyltransferase [Methylobacterium nodulans]ACL61778.1 glycosyl transferase family 2 [Methylobacterium nodulans ORS 2060]
MRRPVVHLYTVCWDEADMLGFFFRHYDPWVDRYVVYDDGSADGSREILRAHPKVELRDFVRSDAESFVLSHRAMQNEAWKESRGTADWIVVTAIDEHLHVPGRAMAEYLAEQADCGVTLVPALGFDLTHPEMPDDAGLLTERVTRGRPRAAFNKLSLFKPEALRETGFGPGRHAAEPQGDLLLPARDVVVLWHYKHLGFERNATREAAQAARLGRADVAQGLGQHYLWGRERLRAFWDKMERESVDLGRVVPDTACIRPLWWEERGLPRADPAPLPPLAVALPAVAPAVSVLVKAYNHAPYVRQTIESVLAQSFQDFEIVVTDDGSTDGTAEILRGFTDPRIRLECWSQNRGISAAMNATIARARGRYLAILNSDDWALPGRLRRQVAFLDANPEISLVFGTPRPVDEEGLPTEALNDFAAPLRFTDSSRRTWLRFFFFQGNILCAPTAMIRREAYAAAGPYDPRLTNLQDFDMWIRMLVAGHRIHVLPDRLTAFRIRANNANTSAPSPETRLRWIYESSKVLRHFAAFSEELFAEVFDTEAYVLSGEPVWLRIAELARRVPRVDYRYFALDTLYEAASEPEHMIRLREWGGSVDALNVREIELRDARIAELTREQDALGRERDDFAAARDAAAAARDQLADEISRTQALHAQQMAAMRGVLAQRERAVADLDARREALESTVQELDFHLKATLASRERMRASLSWRSTAFLRWLGRLRRLAAPKRS